MSNDTIAAIATPPGRGGVGIIRLSGPLAYTIALTLCHKNALKPRYANYTSFYNYQGELIDNGLVLYFNAPHSFTGEDVIELQGHGSPILLDYLLNECLANGARLARPGEFSERAFLNDKMDLTQAEAIADLIQASSLTAARLAVRSLQGEFSDKINQLNQLIINLRLYVEAAIDFPEEEIDFLNDGHVASKLQEIIKTLADIRANASQGALLREGMSVVIAGKPNAGKSTLINCLAGRDVAIVTDIAGTTRDVMREHILIDELPIHIIDTAGLRDSDDFVEREGIKRAWEEVGKADCVLMIIDINEADDVNEMNQAIKERLPSKVPIIKLFNKIDSVSGCYPQQEDALYLSAKTGQGIDLLKERIKSVVGFQPTEGQFLARRRHLHALDTAQNFLLTGQQQLMNQRAGELLAEDLRLAHQSLSEITGEFSSDDLLGKIFSSFCIGK
jgi:tRNA modification GTPase